MAETEKPISKDLSIAVAAWVEPDDKCRFIVPAVFAWVVLFFIAPGHILVRFMAAHLSNIAFLPVLSEAVWTVVLLGIFLALCCGLIILLFHTAQVREDKDFLRVLAAFSYKQSLGSMAATGITIAVVAGGIGKLCHAPVEYYLLVAACLAGLAAPGITPKIIRERRERKEREESEQIIDRLRTQLLEGENIREETYHWTFHPDPCAPLEELEFQITIPVDLSRYEQAASADHTVHDWAEYARFVVEGRTPEVTLVAEELRLLARAHHMSRVQLLRNALDFCHQFQYAYDQDSKGVPEYPRFPIEMLVDREGDCECHAIFAAALLDLLGFDVILLAAAVNTPDPLPNHMAVGIAATAEVAELPETTFYSDGERRYYYCEATPPSGPDGSRWVWHIGEVPFEVLQAIRPIYLKARVVRRDEPGT